MAKIKWLHSFEIGIGFIDEDHKKLVAAIGAIKDALDKAEMTAVLDLFEAFIAQAVAHFESEEAFLKEIDFPRLESHAAAHKELIRRSRNTLTDLRADPDAAAAARALEEMVYFLLEDIIKADAAFKSYAQESGAD